MFSFCHAGRCLPHGSQSAHLPRQNRENISFTTSSPTDSPVICPSASAASLISMVTRSSGILPSNADRAESGVRWRLDQLHVAGIRRNISLLAETCPPAPVLLFYPPGHPCPYRRPPKRRLPACSRGCCLLLHGFHQVVRDVNLFIMTIAFLSRDVFSTSRSSSVIGLGIEHDDDQFRLFCSCRPVRHLLPRRDQPWCGSLPYQGT